MKKQKIYLETTMFNCYFDEDRGIAHDSTVRLFKDIANGKYEAYTSRYVDDELSNTKGEKREKMLGLIAEYDIPKSERLTSMLCMAIDQLKSIPQWR